jgi:hypothetical protein
MLLRSMIECVGAASRRAVQVDVAVQQGNVDLVQKKTATASVGTDQPRVPVMKHWGSWTEKFVSDVNDVNLEDAEKQELALLRRIGCQLLSKMNDGDSWLS